MATKRKKYRCLFDATILLIDKLKYSKQFNITIDFIRMLHGALYSYYRSAAGIFRTPVYNIKVTSKTLKPVHVAEIRTRLLSLTYFINNPKAKAAMYRVNFTKKLNNYSSLEPNIKKFWFAIYCASYIHYQITHIHPFRGGNGRLARLLMCMELARHGYYKYTFPPLLNIAIKLNRNKYIDVLEKADRGDLFPFCFFLADMLQYSLANEKRLVKDLKKRLGR